jgi:hypothetical protein
MFGPTAFSQLRSKSNKTGIMTIGVTGFALVPLQTIVGDVNATALINAQERKIAAGNYTVTQKEKWDAIIQGLREPTRRGYIELIAFPGFFTSASPLNFFVVWPLHSSHPRFSKAGEEVPDIHGQSALPVLNREHSHRLCRSQRSTCYRSALLRARFWFVRFNF